MDPVPGMYENVVPFDFSSLYPTTIVAYNIDYSTFVTDENIPDECCHIIEWTDHVNCRHDTIYVEDSHVCEDYRYRFLKQEYGRGVIPTIIVNLLEARKNTRAHLNSLKNTLDDMKDEEEITRTKNLIKVLNKRQLSYKVSANSMYGAMGVQEGYLPFMPAAMCVTAKGRENLQVAADYLQKNYDCKVIYEDTDSCYTVFPNISNPKMLWKHSEMIEKELVEKKIFPPPMKLEFEEAVYGKFLILTKKRYMWLDYSRDGILSTKIGKKGVLLARRDNSQFVRDIYEGAVQLIFNGKDMNDTLYYVIDTFNKCCAGCVNYKDFIITKSVGAIGDYKEKPLPTNPAQREKRLKDLNCTVEEYPMRCLPAQVQLADKMRKRGIRVDAGQRIEYVVTTLGGPKAKLFTKIEDPKYQQRYANIIHIDYLYYIHLVSKQLDQVLQIVFGIKDFALNQYKLRLKKMKLLQEFKSLHEIKILFENDDTRRLLK
jgi:DNA polymerase elongation subunit (family B)